MKYYWHKIKKTIPKIFKLLNGDIPNKGNSVVLKVSYLPIMYGFITAVVVLAIAAPFVMGIVHTANTDAAISYLEGGGYWVLAGGHCVPGVLNPCSDATTDLGSIPLRWRNLYLSGAFSAAALNSVTITNTGNINTGSISTASITDTTLTAGRVPYVGVGGLITDSGGLTFNVLTNRLIVGNATISGNATINGNLIAKSGRTATFIIASNSSTTTEKNQADIICDGTADQAEINNAITTGYKHIVLLSGNFTTSDRIFLDNNLWLQGQGIGGTVIKITGDYPAIACNSKSYVTLSDLKINANDKNASPNAAINFNTNTQINLFNLAVVNSGMFCVNVMNSSYGTIDNIYCETSTGASKDGVHLWECDNFVCSNIFGHTGDDLFAITAADADAHDISVSNIVGSSYTADVLRISIELGAAPGTDIYNISANGIVGYGTNAVVIVTSEANGTVSKVSLADIDGGSSVLGMEINGLAGGTVSDIHIDGFNINTTSSYGIDIDTVTRLSLSNGSILNASAASLRLNACTTTKISDVNIYTAVPGKPGVSIIACTDLMFKSVTSNAPGNCFWFTTTTSTKISMDSCKTIGAVGIKVDVAITDGVIDGNDFTQATTVISGTSALNKVSFGNNIGFNPSSYQVVLSEASHTYVGSGACNFNGNGGQCYMEAAASKSSVIWSVIPFDSVSSVGQRGDFIDFSKRIVLTFNVMRTFTDAQAIHLFQLGENKVVIGNFTAPGIGIRIVNMRMYLQCYGTVLGNTDTGVDLTTAQMMRVMIINDPVAQACYCYIDTDGTGYVLKATDTTATHVPQAITTNSGRYCLSSANGAGGTQSFIDVGSVKFNIYDN